MSCQAIPIQHLPCRRDSEPDHKKHLPCFTVVIAIYRHDVRVAPRICEQHRPLPRREPTRRWHSWYSKMPPCVGSSCDYYSRYADRSGNIGPCRTPPTRRYSPDTGPTTRSSADSRHPCFSRASRDCWSSTAKPTYNPVLQRATWPPGGSGTRCTFSDVLANRPGDVLHFGLGLSLLSAVLGLAQRRQQHRGQDGDNRNHHEQLHQ